MPSRVLAIFVILLVAVPALSQSRPPTAPPSGGGNFNSGNLSDDPSSSGSVDVEVQITDERSQPLGVQAIVEVSNMRGEIHRAGTNSEGRVSFRLQPATAYQVSVTGPQIQNARTSIQLLPGQAMENVRIEVKWREGAKPADGLVSSSMMNIPGKARAEFDKGVQEMNQNKLESAKKHFEKAIQEYPKFDWAYNNLGVVDMQLKDTEGARQAFTKAVELNDKNPDATANLAKLKYSEKDYAGAAELMQKSLAVQPNVPKNLYVLAYSQFQLAQYDACLPNAEKIHQGEPDPYPLGHFLAARVYDMKGDTASARRQYEAYLKEAPDGSQAALAKSALVRLDAKK